MSSGPKNGPDPIEVLKSHDPGMSAEEFVARITKMQDVFIERSKSARESLKQTGYDDKEKVEEFVEAAKDVYVFGKLIYRSIELVKENNMLTELIEDLMKEIGECNGINVMGSPPGSMPN